MTNNEIALLVYKTYKLKGICFKLGIKNNVDDMAQILYEIILNANNDELNNVIKNGAMLSWIFVTIRNTSTNKGRKTEWAKLKTNLPYIENIEVEEEPGYDWEKEWKLQFLDEEFETKTEREVGKMSYAETNYFIKKLMLKNKIQKGWTLDDIRDKFGISRNRANNIIQESKKELRQKYDSRNKNG